ncbi:MAG TPA: hypothetical protein VEM41_05730 [Actinomycetota bacterium]|nr:hypothetical protein [Actinomycetota bacterium]
MLKPPFEEMTKDDSGRLQSAAETHRQVRESGAPRRRFMRGMTTLAASALRRAADRLDPLPDPRSFATIEARPNRLRSARS